MHSMVTVSKEKKKNEEIYNILQREIIIATEDNNRSTDFHAFNVGFYLSISICVLRLIQ